jgi:hypothetical protein
MEDIEGRLKHATIAERNQCIDDICEMCKQKNPPARTKNGAWIHIQSEPAFQSRSECSAGAIHERWYHERTIEAESGLEPERRERSDG